MLSKEQAFGMYWGQKTIFNNDIDTIEVMGRDIFVNMQYLRNSKKNNLKLILRPFESMTDEECIDYEMLEYGEFRENSFYSLKELEWLIEHGFDVFNLKERGWAVYESDLKGSKK